MHLNQIGSLLQGNGWTSALTEAGVASSGTSESFLSASSITSTWQAHQITAAALSELIATVLHCQQQYQRYDVS